MGDHGVPIIRFVKRDRLAVTAFARGFRGRAFLKVAVVPWDLQFTELVSAFFVLVGATPVKIRRIACCRFDPARFRAGGEQKRVPASAGRTNSNVLRI